MNGQPDHHQILSRTLLLVPTVRSNLEWHYIKHFSVNKCQLFEGTGHNLWIILVPYNALKVLPSVPCEQGYFLKREKDRVFD